MCFFFFFKQKTAYDMRISDWSSDVCSSDLAGLCFAGDLGAWHIGILKTTMANATLFGNCATLIYPIYGFLIARAWPTRVQGLALVMALAGGALLMGRSSELSPDNVAGDQIGRASCRERVWQVVSITVVAVSLTKKKTTKATVT